MYELTCTACRYVMTTPFVRPGAIAVCRKCGQAFPVKEETYRRAGTDGGAEAAREPVAAATAAATAAGSDEVVAEIDEGPADEGTRDFTAEELRPPPAQTETDARPAAERLRALQRRRQVLTLGVLGVAVLLVLVGALALLLTAGHAAPRLVPLDPDLALVSATRLPEGHWEPISPPQPLPPAPTGPVQLSRVELTGQGGQPAVEAEVLARGPESFEWATVQLVLLDENGEAVAHAQALAGLLLAQRPERLRLAVPREIAARAEEVTGWAEGGNPLRGVEPFSDVYVEKQHDPQRPAVKLTAYNPLDRPLRRARFVLRGMDAEGRPVSAWKAEWPQEVGPRQRVEFAVLLPSASDTDVAVWEARGVGQP